MKAKRKAKLEAAAASRVCKPPPRPTPVLAQETLPTELCELEAFLDTATHDQKSDKVTDPYTDLQNTIG